MFIEEDLFDVSVSYEGLNKMRSELKRLLFKQEESYLKELNAFKALKALIKIYEVEIERRVKEAEEYV